ncbi:hypothetical protein EXU85_20635 [Spirosoma sp. KCTC 42546]|uniref:hypothetical protein n=1 Tax=Spirosoma sp. KCTC 42546 TaxID=2520506 RepID=UPI00115B66BE|nr:hypothetical protein [Spirosoma sp. KCTC 42546]QDK80888.1 hypothetical protein EXU85_20635 [Spirosoma sp. KCTC 42546]
MKSLLKIFRTITIIGGTLCISYFLIKETSINKTKIVEGEFLFTLLGVLLGFAFTLLTFIISMLDKIKEQVAKDVNKTKVAKDNIMKRIGFLHSELRQDIYFIFITFIIVGVSIIAEKINFPFSEFINSLGTTKIEILNILKFSIFLLNLYVIYDLLEVTFSVSETTSISSQP